MTQLAVVLLAHSFNLGYIQVPQGAWKAPDPGASYTPFLPQPADSLDMTCYGWVNDTSYGILSFSVTKDGNWAYAVVHTDDLGYPDSLVRIYDLSDSTNPHEVGSFRAESTFQFWPKACLVDDTLLYTVGYNAINSRFRVYNITNPVNPFLVSETDSVVRGQQMLQVGNVVYSLYLAGAAPTRFYAVDVSDPFNPQRTYYETLSDASIGDLFYHPEIAPPYLFLMLGNTWTEGGGCNLLFYDISDPQNPYPVGSLDCIYSCESGLERYILPKSIVAYTNLSLKATHVWFLGGYTFCFDITDIHNPEPKSYWLSDDYLMSSDVHENRAYVTGALYGVLVYDLDWNTFYWWDTLAYYHLADYWVWRSLTNTLWKDDKVYASTSRPQDDNPWRLAIYHYLYDEVEENSPGSSGHYLEWLRTIYDRPELRFSLSQEANVSFSLFNSAGQRAFEKDLGLLEPGSHTIDLPGLKAGVYFLFMETNEEKLSRKVVFSNPD